MDYRNADGSVAEMCGNGVRVFMRYLQRVSLVNQDAAVATRGGVVRVRAEIGGDITVEMGRPRILADRPVATVAQLADGPAVSGAGAAVLMPNPHVVVPVPSEGALAALDLSRPPRVDPELPDGQNVEFVTRRGARHLGMRVHERGVGETRSCGTGICAAVVATAAADGSDADGEAWRVDVPGGTCTVTWRTDGLIELAGPAVLLAEIDVDEAWLAARAGVTAE
jgi:diaminopimelate epimerase